LEIANQNFQKGNYNEALQLVKKIEKRDDISPEDRLSVLMLKGWIYKLTRQIIKGVEVGNLAYELSQKLNNTLSCINALLFKAQVYWLGKHKEANKLILEAEKLLDSLFDVPKSTYSRIKSEILYYKALLKSSKEDHQQALDLAMKSLDLAEHAGSKLLIAINLSLLARISLNLGEFNAALDYGLKNLELQRKISVQSAIAQSLSLVGFVYNYKGDFNKAINHCKQSLKIKEIRDETKIEVYGTLGYIYTFKGETNKAIKYHEKAVDLAEKLDRKAQLAVNTMALGTVQSMRGNLSIAIEYYQRALSIAEEIRSYFVIGMTLMNLIQIYSQETTLKQAEQYLPRSKVLADQNEGQFTHMYLHARAYFLYKRGRSRDRVEAEILWKKIIDDKIYNPTIYILTLWSLCMYLIDEMEMSNDMQLLDEINPIIQRLINIGEKTHSYSTIAYTKFFQAKLALIQMDIEKSKLLLTQAQRVAELHDLSITAIYISNEHDTLLEQAKTWEKLNKDNAPISERIKFAAIDGIKETLLGKGIQQTSELIDEDPILILITGEGGVLLFSNPFSKDIGFEEDLISGFLTAFNDFSGELFSKSLDRAKFDDYTLLMDSIGSFSVSYLFKGKTYLAKQKLTKLIEKIQKNNSIMDTLSRFYETSQVVEVKDIPILGSLLSEIFAPQTK
jgi:tetratricopeptide (TPR) repeat protein